MFTNYLKSALRNIARRKIYSLINILGLALGLASTFLIVLYLQYEFGFDRFHKNHENIYRMVCRQKNNIYLNNDTYAVTPYLAGPTAETEIPAVLNSVRLKSANFSIKTENNRGQLSGFYADSSFFRIFSFRLLAGNPTTALSEPNSLILDRTNAQALFGDQNPVGMNIEADGVNYTVTGVMEDAPQNSHLQFSCLCSMDTFTKNENQDLLLNWTNSWFITYLELRKNADPAVIENDLFAMIETHTDSVTAQGNILHLQPLGSIHLFSNVNFDNAYNNSNINIIYLFISIGFLILVVACFNYLNLTSAYSSLRFKEIGVRKIVGARNSSLLKQFLCESIVIAFLAMFLACVLVEAVLPFFNDFVNRNVDLEYSLLNVLSILGITVLTGLLAGIYPAVIMSSFSPISIISRKKIFRQYSLRNIFVIIQLGISVFLILAAIIVRQQMKFVNDADSGYDRENVIVVRVFDKNVREHYREIKKRLEGNTDILKVSSSNCLPSMITSKNSNTYNNEEGKLETVIAYEGKIDYDFLDLYNIDILDGRGFSGDIPSDAENSAIINETFAKSHNLQNPVGKKIRGKTTIIGVVRDFNFASFHHAIEPLILTLSPSSNRMISIKTSGEHRSGVLGYIEKVYNDFKIDQDFYYYHYDDLYSGAYISEYRLGKIFGYFSLLAIFLSCLGLYGLAAYQIHRRVKEMGIRKVLGASLGQIILALSRDFMKWIIIANLIAWPLGFYFMNKWLQNFAYRINISISYYVLSGMIVFGIAALTILYQTLRAARANPVRALKYE